MQERTAKQALFALMQAHRCLRVYLLASVHVESDGELQIRDAAQLENALLLAEQWQLMR